MLGVGWWIVLAGGQTGWAVVAGEEVTDNFQYFNFNINVALMVLCGGRWC